MAIDIDSFLQKYNVEVKDADKQKPEEKIGLDFQKDIEDKLLKTETKIHSDIKFEILEKIYDEIKKFDEDIPSKFLGIENKGNLALKTVGEKYSKEFLLRIKQNVLIMDKNIGEHFQIFDSKLNSEDFSSLIKEFELLLNLIEKYPREFLKEKLRFSEELRKREIVINKKINEYKLIKLKELKLQINMSILDLNKNLIPDNIVEIEGKLFSLQNLLKHIPKIFLTEMTNEKIIISKVLIQAERYLEKEYVIEYTKKEENINKLFEKFHTSYINKDLSKTLILYDEILLEFESLPEVFFEKKMGLYEQINELYAMINDLFIKNNLSILVQSYNVSQIFKESRDYLRHIELTSKLNIETVLKLENKISSLPEKCEPEKSDILKKIAEIKLKYSQKKEPITNNLENASLSSEDKSDNSDFCLKNEQKGINKDILNEINSHYNKIKKSNNKEEIKLNYKKILFYLNNLNLKIEDKKEIITKLNKLISEKNNNS